MKKLIIIAALAALYVPAKSQNTHRTTTTTQSTNNGYNGTSNTTTTTTTDQVYADHWGPQGETVYVTGSKKYYYKDKAGKKHYGKESSFKTKSKTK